MVSRMAQTSLFVVALFVGLLIVGQLRSQSTPIALSSLSAQELSTLLETLNARNVELTDALADLREQLRAYELADAQGRSDLAISEESLRGISAFAGLSAVTGQGVVIQVEGSFDPTAVNDLIYELRNAGAEAISIDDVRITARTVAALGTGAIELDGVPIGSKFEIRAIGSPDGLRSAIERPGGIMRLLQQSVSARFLLTEERQLTVPATQRDLFPTSAVAVE